jgi:cytochrome c-type biogenesis protein CcsB
VNLDQLSLLSLYTAMGIYVLAFVAYAFDLAHRSTQAKHSTQVTTPTTTSTPPHMATVPEPSPIPQAASSTQVATAVTNHRATTTVLNTPPPNTTTTKPSPRNSPSLRIGVALTIIAFLFHLTADITRGLAAERVPWANMYEFAMTGTLLIIAVYLIVLTVVDLRFLGTFVTGLVLILLGVATVNFYVSVAPLPPALQSYWLVIHVFVASLSTAFFAFGFALSLLQLLQFRHESTKKTTRPRFLTTLPNSQKLENLAYRVNIIGFIFWTFTLIAGAIWAEKAWGRYWGWDTKEVWTFIIWVIYAGYIHARATRGWRGNRSAWLAIIGFTAIIFNFTIVNVFFKGLHAYSGL